MTTALCLPKRPRWRATRNNSEASDQDFMIVRSASGHHIAIVDDESDACLIALAPRLAFYVQQRAETGDKDAQKLAEKLPATYRRTMQSQRAYDAS